MHQTSPCTWKCWQCPPPPWVFRKETHHPFLSLYECGNELCCLGHQDKHKPDQITRYFNTYFNGLSRSKPNPKDKLPTKPKKGPPNSTFGKFMIQLIVSSYTWLSIKSFVSWSPLLGEHWLVSDTRPMLVSFWQLLFSPRLLFITMSLGPSLKDWHRRATPLISTAP